MINSRLCGWGLSRPQIKKKIDQDSILQKNLKFLMPNRISKVRTTIQMISTLGNPKTSKKVQGIKKWEITSDGNQSCDLIRKPNQSHSDPDLSD
jgi:hypothetical protein